MDKRSVNWKGAFVVSVTPFTEEGAIDQAAFEKCLDYYLSVGADGIIVGGHNGESWVLDQAEFVRLTEIAAGVIHGRIPLLIGVEGIVPENIIAVANACETVGAEGLMVQPPYLLTTATKDEIIYRYRTIAQGIGIPLMLYNNPRRTQIHLTPPLVEELTDIDKVVAIKESSGDFRHITELIRRCGERISIFAGPGEVLFPALAIGADGFITSGTVELLGRQGVKLVEAVKSGDYAEAQRIHFRVARIYSGLFGLGTWPASMKEAMNIMGIPAGYPRRPVLPLQKEERARLESMMRELELIT